MKFLFSRQSILLLVFVLPLVFGTVQTSFTMDAQFTVRLSLLGGYFALISIYHLFFDRNVKLKITAPVLCFAALLLWQITGAFYSINFADALATCSITAVFLSFLVIIPSWRISYENMERVFLYAVLLLTAVMLITGIFELVNVVLNAGYSHEALYNLRGTIGHKNAFSEYLFLLLPFNIYLAFSASRTIRLFGVVQSFLIVSLVILSLTRSVWVAFPVAVLFTVGIALYHGTFRLRRKIIVFSIAAGVAVLFALVLWMYLNPESPFSKQVMALFNFKHGSVKDRLGLWSKTLTLWAENPLIGKGTASWKVEFLRAGNEGLTSENNVVFYQRPHNDWLWLLFENGLVGLSIKLLAVFFIFKLLMSNLKASHGRIKEKMFLLAVLFSLVSFHVIEQFSFPVERPVFVVLSAMIWVLIVKKSMYNAEPLYKLSGIHGFSLIAAIATLVFLLGFGRMLSESELKTAMKHRKSGNHQEVIEGVERAETFYYRLDPFSTPLRWYAATARFMTGKQEVACIGFEEALQFNPYHIYILNDVGTCNGIQGNTGEAVKSYRKSLDMAPNFNETLYNLTTLYYQIGGVDSAVFYLRQIDPEPDSARYAQYLQVILKPLVEDLIDEVDEQELQNELTNMKYNNDWLTSVLRKPEDAHVKFRISALTNALYIMKKNHTFAPEKINELYKKYHL